VLRIKEAIVVEGRYDKNTLAQLVDTVILETRGFAIFRDKEQLELLRRIAKARGLLILTDSDSAGFLIRNHLKGAIPMEQVKHAYIPDIFGKEHRKRQPGSEGKIGVEGMSPQVLEAALRRGGATFLDQDQNAPKQTQSPITKTDLYLLGLSGGEGSAQARRGLLAALKLPEHLSPNALLPVLNALYTREDFFALAQGLETPRP